MIPKQVHVDVPSRRSNHRGLALTLLAGGDWSWAVKTVLARRKKKLDKARNSQSHKSAGLRIDLYISARVRETQAAQRWKVVNRLHTSTEQGQGREIK